ncbi:linear amide C-N hydrolase [Shewanella violacea]|uniref:Choloylglycine hydrolase family protein n=1 Tax=Shewanella violacea (strain JCM 10179 / CIP 106290 / LMG 19151 / DSS12) TaxID=637905 RepID=D4ZDP3_SHEVD|nr:linear amide C-N hydrolase [Shewanella violacea]BAJ03954.1 choloylglycine hydrolase family protein [Shewanella violacea DSS12]
MCSKITWATQNHGVFVARTMDWFAATNPEAIITPKGVEKDYGFFSKESKFSTFGITTYGYILDGVNDAGLSGHGLYFATALDYENKQSLPKFNLNHLVNFGLSECGNVVDLVKLIEQHHITICEVTDFGPGTIHASFSDITGDNCVIEIENGSLNIWHGKQYNIMTNQPGYNKQLNNWERVKRSIDLAPHTGYTHIQTGGNINPEDRFIHNNYMSSHLKEPTSNLNGHMKLVTNIYKIPQDVPNRVEGEEIVCFPTEFVISYNLNNLTAHFLYTMNDAYMKYNFDISELFTRGVPLRFRLDQADLHGDITEKFLAS